MDPQDHREKWVHREKWALMAKRVHKEYKEKLD
jgi:hypothetical protein